MKKLVLAILALVAISMVAACAETTVKEVPVEVIVEKEIIKEVPVDRIVMQEVVKEVHGARRDGGGGERGSQGSYGARRDRGDH